MNVIIEEIRRIQDETFYYTLLGIIEDGADDNSLEWLQSNLKNRDVVGECSEKEIKEWIEFIVNNRSE